MEKYNETHLKTLVDNEQWGEAQKYLEAFFKQNIPNAEIGRAYASLTSMYVASENELNKQYLNFLDNALAMLKDLQKEEKAVEDKIDLELTRSQLKKD